MRDADEVLRLARAEARRYRLQAADRDDLVQTLALAVLRAGGDVRGRMRGDAIDWLRRRTAWRSQDASLRALRVVATEARPHVQDREPDPYAAAYVAEARAAVAAEAAVGCRRWRSAVNALLREEPRAALARRWGITERAAWFVLAGVRARLAWRLRRFADYCPT